MSTRRACHRTVLALPWLLNGSLEAEERRQVREHLIGCPACRAELARTRETLVLFGGAERRAMFGGAERRAVAAGTTAAPAAAAAEHPRSGKVLRRLAWAAMIALVVSSVGGLWLGTRDSDAHPAQATLPAPTQTAAPMPQPAAPADVIFSTSFEGGSLAALPVETSPARPAKRPASPVRIAVARPAQPPPSQPNQISSADFESGDLGQWQ